MRALTEASDPTREDWAFKVNLDTCQTHFMRALTEASDPTREDWAFKVSLDTCQAHFMRALTEASDPTREDWAFKVSLGIEPNTQTCCVATINLPGKYHFKAFLLVGS